MNEFTMNLFNYAKLTVEIGVNIQKGQTLHIRSAIDNVDFVRHITKIAYEKGAANVYVDWSDDVITRTRYELAPTESFGSFPEWKALERNKLAEEKAAFLSIVSESPDLLAGIDAEKLKATQQATGQALVPFRRLMQADHFSWSVIAAPSKDWASKVFPELPEDEQVQALWKAIFKAVRIDTPNPVDEWEKHDQHLQEKVATLNEMRIKNLHYTAPGTDLTIGLPEGHLWAGGSSVNSDGHRFMANMPTEEVFTVPHREKVNGYVSSTKPLSYSGNIIDNFKITFENGKIVAIEAEQGQDVLQQLIDTDEGARMLGEVALVPHDSPISNANLLFYNTLFDENASNHLAIGSAYTFCLEGGKTMTPEETKAAGLNESITHVDFMIGSEQMDITAELHSGETVQLFKDGNWAF